MLRLLVSVALVALAAGDARAQSSAIVGTATYRERVALGPAAVLEVTLEDVSRADRSSVVVASLRLDDPGQVPIQFELPYEPSRILPANRYSVRARIVEAGQVRFETTEDVLALTQGHGASVSLILNGASPSGSRARVPSAAPAGARAPVSLPRPVPLTGLPATYTGTLPCDGCPGTRVELNLFPGDSYVMRMTDLGGASETTRDAIGSWVLSSDRRVVVLQGAGQAPVYFSIRDNLTLRQLDADGRSIDGGRRDLRRTAAFQPVEVRLTMRGAYRSTGDGVEFVECSTGQRWTVDAGGAGSDLAERARAAARQPGDSVIVSLDGRVRPASLPAGQRPVLTVERVVSTSATEQCTPRFAGVPLQGTAWRLSQLGDRPVASPGGASLTFRSDPSTFSAASGCNRFAGSYRTVGEDIALTTAGTMMACAGAPDAALTAAIRDARRYRILGPMLDFYDANHRLLARFRATGH